MSISAEPGDQCLLGSRTPWHGPRRNDEIGSFAVPQFSLVGFPPSSEVSLSPFARDSSSPHIEHLSHRCGRFERWRTSYARERIGSQRGSLLIPFLPFKHGSTLCHRGTRSVDHECFRRATSSSNSQRHTPPRHLRGLFRCRMDCEYLHARKYALL